jgi:hypothetical protein
VIIQWGYNLYDNHGNTNNNANSDDLESNSSGNYAKTLDIERIFNNIAPYLSEPDIIMSFLKSHLNVSIDELKDLVEVELKSDNPIRRTDFRILLNSI